MAKYKPIVSKNSPSKSPMITSSFLDRTFKKCSNEAHTSESSSSMEASSPVHHYNEINVDVPYKLSAANLIHNLNKNYLHEANIIPTTSLGPVKSKMDRSRKSTAKISETSSKNNKSQPSKGNGNGYKLPTLLQDGLKRLSLTLDDADDEASTQRSENSLCRRRRSAAENMNV